MKLFTFTDVHSSLSLIRKLKERAERERPDVVLCCGDLTIFGMDTEKVIGTLSQFPMDMVLVHGNHDDDGEIKNLCAKHPTLHFIHGTFFVKDGFIFLGYGGDGFALEDEQFKRIEGNLQRALDQNPGKRAILVTHAPPYKTKLDALYGGHCGNNSIRKFIEKNKILFSVCGHIHENFGQVDSIKNTRILNPGPNGKMVTIEIKK